MKKTLLLLPLYFLLIGCSLSNTLSYAGGNTPAKMDITILDQTILHYQPLNGLPFSEISDMSYDAHNHTLYMIGDKGYFHTFSATFGQKIETLKYLSTVRVREQKGESSHDIEGLTHNDKGALLISLEGTPRIAHIDNTGLLSNNFTLTQALSDKKNYSSGNTMFEALAWHPKYGILTAGEYPLYHRKNTEQSIYDLNGKTWNFKAAPHTNNAVTALEVMDDGNLLVLERAYSGLSNPFVITLRKVYLDQCDKNNNCQSKVLASFNSYDGWGVNNYEGLTKVGKNRYLMVSDNNNEPFLQTVLIYFEVKE